MRPRALLVAHLCEEAADLSSGWSPLHVAACMDDVEATEALLQAGFSALAEAPLTRATPLSCAAVCGSQRALTSLCAFQPPAIEAESIKTDAEKRAALTRLLPAVAELCDESSVTRLGPMLTLLVRHGANPAAQSEPFELSAGSPARSLSPFEVLLRQCLPWLAWAHLGLESSSGQAEAAAWQAAAQSLAVGTAFAQPSEGEPPSAAAVGAQAVGRLLLAYVPFGIWPAKAQEELRTALVTRQDGRWADAPLHAFAMAPHAALLPVVQAAWMSAQSPSRRSMS